VSAHKTWHTRRHEAAQRQQALQRAAQAKLAASKQETDEASRQHSARLAAANAEAARAATQAEAARAAAEAARKAVVGGESGGAGPAVGGAGAPPPPVTFEGPDKELRAMVFEAYGVHVSAKEMATLRAFFDDEARPVGGVGGGGGHGGDLAPGSPIAAALAAAEELAAEEAAAEAAALVEGGLPAGHALDASDVILGLSPGRLTGLDTAKYKGSSLKAYVKWGLGSARPVDRSSGGGKFGRRKSSTADGDGKVPPRGYDPLQEPRGLVGVECVVSAGATATAPCRLGMAEWDSDGARSEVAVSPQLRALGSGEVWVTVELFLESSSSRSGSGGDRLVGSASVPFSSLILGESASCNLVKVKTGNKIAMRGALEFTLSARMRQARRGTATSSGGLAPSGAAASLGASPSGGGGGGRGSSLGTLLEAAEGEEGDDDGAVVARPPKPPPQRLPSKGKKDAKGGKRRGASCFNAILARQPVLSSASFVEHMAEVVVRCDRQVVKVADETARKRLAEVFGSFDSEGLGFVSLEGLVECYAALRTGKGALLEKASQTTSAADEATAATAAVAKARQEELDGRARAEAERAEAAAAKAKALATANPYNEEAQAAAAAAAALAATAALAALGDEASLANDAAVIGAALRTAGGGGGGGGGVGDPPPVRHDSLFTLTRGLSAAKLARLIADGALPGGAAAEEGLSAAKRRRLELQWGDSMDRHPIYDLLVKDAEEEHRRRHLRFRVFRALEESLRPLPRSVLAPFPKSYTKSLWGRELTADQLSRRFKALAAWLEDVEAHADDLSQPQREFYENWLYGEDGIAAE